MTTTTLKHFCTCGGKLRVLDAEEFSITAACNCCKCCWLLIQHPDFAVNVALSDFHLKRGDGLDRRPLGDLTMATQLVVDLLFDVWPSPATVVDFGIDSNRHLGALQYAVHAGVTAYDLDRVMGDGPAITRLVRGVPDQPYADVEFQTAYDDYHCEEVCCDER
jgi:hypothetical protein